MNMVIDESFVEKWCDKCVKCPISSNAKGQCRTMGEALFGTTPRQIKEIDGDITCTAFKSRDEHNKHRKQRRKKKRRRWIMGNCLTEKQVLDPCCGSKMFWFQKEHQSVLFADIRDEEQVLCDGRQLMVHPDIIADFRDMPFDDESFNLIVFDPPHLRWAGDKSWMKKKYGTLNRDTWPEDFKQGFDECWRVLAPGGTLIFKWNEAQIKLKRVLGCFSQQPLFGHATTKNLKTHWLVFYKPVMEK